MTSQYCRLKRCRVSTCNFAGSSTSLLSKQIKESSVRSYRSLKIHRSIGQAIKDLEDLNVYKPSSRISCTEIVFSLSEGEAEAHVRVKKFHWSMEQITTKHQRSSIKSYSVAGASSMALKGEQYELSAYTRFQNDFPKCTYVGCLSGCMRAVGEALFERSLQSVFNLYMQVSLFLMGHCFGKVCVESVLTPSQKALGDRAARSPRAACCMLLYTL